jgi:putative hydrolase of the HAD superfamily
MPRLGNPKVVLFDLDDTLLDFSSNVVSAWSEALALLPGECAVEEEVLVPAIRAKSSWYWSCPDRHRVGRQRLRETGAEIVAETLADLGEMHALDFPLRLSCAYRDLRDESLALIDGAIECLERHRSAGRRLGLVTNGSSVEQRAKIARFSLGDFFEHVQVEGELGIGKPDERAFEHALGQFAVEASEAWMIGDNLEWDVLAPKRAGLRAAWVCAGAALPGDVEAQPDLIVSSVAEF